MAITAADIIAILRDELFIEVDELEHDSLLFTNGLLDSFSLVGLINEIERRGGFRIAPFDITLENFDSVERILRFANRQQADAAPVQD